MNRKVSILIISVILTVIVFCISTYMQKKLINYIPTMKCMIVSKDIEAYEQINEDSVKYVEMPIEIIANTRTIQDISEVKDLYLKDKIYKGQLLLFEQFDTKENLNIYNAEDGKEKISIKIKSAENGVSYTLRENSIINIYATLRREYINSELFSGDIVYIGTENDGYCTTKILDSIKVLGSFDINGESVENNMEKNIDTILIAVGEKEAGIINLYRDIATFSVTEL